MGEGGTIWEEEDAVKFLLQCLLSSPYSPLQPIIYWTLAKKSVLAPRSSLGNSGNSAALCSEALWGKRANKYHVYFFVWEFSLRQVLMLPTHCPTFETVGRGYAQEKIESNPPLSPSHLFVAKLTNHLQAKKPFTCLNRFFFAQNFIFHNLMPVRYSLCLVNSPPEWPGALPPLTPVRNTSSESEMGKRFRGSRSFSLKSSSFYKAALPLTRAEQRIICAKLGVARARLGRP